MPAFLVFLVAVELRLSYLTQYANQGAGEQKTIRCGAPKRDVVARQTYSGWALRT
jgi:hypothetical protein